MSILAEFMIVAGVDNHPPMIDKPMYESWKSRMELYSQELSDKEKLQADCDLKATNIVLQGLPLDVYSLVNHHKVAKEIWNRVKLLMQGTSLSNLSPEWGKFVTDVKLARDLHTSNYDQLYAYLKQHEAHANEARLMRIAVLIFLHGDDPIACMKKAMAFLSAVFSSRCPSTNNQLRSSSNLRSQRNASGSWGNTSGQAKAEAFQTDDLDAYDSDCDDISSAKAVLMANLSSCNSAVLSEVPYSDTFQNDMMNQGVQELQYSKQSPIIDYLDNEITSDSNIIPYSQYLEETQHAIDKANNKNKIVSESLTAELERYRERVKILKQRFNVDLSSREIFIDSQMDDMIQMKNTKFAAFETEIDTLKQTLSKHFKEKESLLTTLNGFKIAFKQRESKSIDK
ncbi:hypothetical protein Tco_1319845 [Tanacetum coccineum]